MGTAFWLFVPGLVVWIYAGKHAQTSREILRVGALVVCPLAIMVFILQILTARTIPITYSWAPTALVAFVLVPMALRELTLRSLWELLTSEVPNPRRIYYAVIWTWCGFFALRLQFLLFSERKGILDLGELWLSAHPVTFPLICLIGPALEEIYYRGLIWRILPNDLGIFGKAILTSLPFAGLHLAMSDSARSMPMYFLLAGFVFGTVRGSLGIRWAIVCHAVTNVLIISWELVQG